MDIVTPQQVLSLVALLALLGGAALWARRLRSGAGMTIGGLKLGGGGPRRLRVAEVLALSPADSAMILEVDARPYLVLRQRGAAAVVTALPGPDTQPEDRA